MMVPVLQKVTGGQATQTPKFMASEDFSEFQKLVPGMYIVLGATRRARLPPPRRRITIRHSTSTRVRCRWGQRPWRR